MHLSPPALSQHIKALEKELGVQLFDRTTKGVILTEAGHTFLPHAQRLLRTVDFALEEMRTLASEKSGIIRVGLFANNAADLTIPILQRFRTAHPNVQINFVPLDFKGQITGLIEDRVDVAFVRPPITNERMVVHILGHEPRVAVVSSQSELADAESLTLNDIRGRRFIDPGSLDMPPEWTDFWLLLSEREERIPTHLSDSRLPDFEAVAMDIAINETMTTVPASMMRDVKDVGISAIPIEGLDCALAIATRSGATGLAESFCSIAKETYSEIAKLPRTVRPQI